MIVFCVIIEIDRLLMALLSKTLAKIQLYKLLATLETSPGDYVTLYIRPSSFPHYINELALQPRYITYADEIKEAVNIKAVAHAIEAYNTGTAIYWQKNGNRYIVLPPFPITEDKISIGELDASILSQMLKKNIHHRRCTCDMGNILHRRFPA